MSIGRSDCRRDNFVAAPFKDAAPDGGSISRRGGHVRPGAVSISDWDQSRPAPQAVGAALAEKGSLPLLLAIAFILGLTVTVAEPNTRVLSHYVEIASGGRIDATTLITAVALGVAIFVSLALMRLFLNIPLAYLVGAGCAIGLFILIFTSLRRSLTPEGDYRTAFPGPASGIASRRWERVCP